MALGSPCASAAMRGSDVDCGVPRAGRSVMRCSGVVASCYQTSVFALQARLFRWRCRMCHGGASSAPGAVETRRQANV